MNNSKREKYSVSFQSRHSSFCTPYVKVVDERFYTSNEYFRAQTEGLIKGRPGRAAVRGNNL
jgi:hypothetical protein